MNKILFLAATIALLASLTLAWPVYHLIPEDIEFSKKCTAEYAQEAVCKALTEEAKIGDRFADRLKLSADKACAKYEQLKDERVKFMAERGFQYCEGKDVRKGALDIGPKDAAKMIKEIREH